MYLKRLEIVGFKSFTERTQVTFGPGISAVVGPNGCGKSNIIDAIRWVMGEQSPKLLRARNMEDLLFNGSQNRPPALVAEVTLTLARDDDPARGQAEVSVTRRLYRGGESEYLINRTQGRLKDVVRFFIEAGMGTRNYSIIEQEKVGRLVDAPPEERRLLIDEAAGVTRYKEQKRESEKRLESAGQNLVTVSAMLAETSKRLSMVSRAAAKAAKWKAIREELKSLELRLSARTLLSLVSKLAELSAEAAETRSELSSREALVAEAELRIDKARIAETFSAQSLEEAMSRWHRSQAAYGELKNELEHNGREKEAAEEGLKRAHEELESLSGQGDNQENEKQGLSERVLVLEEELREADAERSAQTQLLKGAESLGSEAGRKKAALEKELSLARDSLQRRIESRAGEEGRIKILKENLKKYLLERNRSDELIEEAERALSSRERHQAALEDDLAAAEKSRLEIAKKLSQAREALDEGMRDLGAMERKTAALASRFETLDNLKSGGFGWYPEGVKALLGDCGSQGLISPVAEALKVPDGFEEAAEAFLGERLGWILAEDRSACLAALKKARELGLGRCGLISKADAKDGDILSALLGPLELLDELPETLSPKSQKAIVTRRGDYLGPLMAAGGGSAKGAQERGSPEKSVQAKSRQGQGGQAKGSPDNAAKAKSGEKGAADSLLARLKELEALGRELKGVEEEKRAAEEAVRAKRSDLKAYEEELAGADAQRSALASDLSEARSKAMVAKSEAKGLAIRRGALSGEMERCQAQIKASEELLSSAAGEQETLSQKVSELDGKCQEAAVDYEEKTRKLEEIRQKSRAAADKTDKLAELLEGARRELARLEAWLGNLAKRRASLDRQMDAGSRKLLELSEKREAALASMEGLPEAVAEAEGQVAELRKAVIDCRAGVTFHEEAARAARKAREESLSALSALDASIMEANYSLARLKADLLKDWRVVLAGPKDEVEDPQEALLASQEPNQASEEGLGGQTEEAGSIGSDEDGGSFGEEQGVTSFNGQDEGQSVTSGSSQGEQGVTKDSGQEEPGVTSFNGQDEGQSVTSGSSQGEQSVTSFSRQEEQGVTGGASLEEGQGPKAPSPPASHSLQPSPVEAESVTEEAAKTSAETWEKQSEQAPPERLDPFDLADAPLPQDAEAAIGRLRERLSAMGEINHTAIDEEAELKARLGFQQAQHDDLTEAINDLKDSIERVSQTCQKRFFETFGQADIKFREIFPVLFEGGEGWLSLTDESDPLESGVEIHVHPPGKKIMVMRSLSGGEKTLTSLCLIFALYLIKPSPYCLLDEADAPLDEANIDRFNRLLRNLSEASQIIMVTHNKRTMQISDTLYGVTMETPGVSRLVSVNLSEAEVLSNG